MLVPNRERTLCKYPARHGRDSSALGSGDKRVLRSELCSSVHFFRAEPRSRSGRPAQISALPFPPDGPYAQRDTIKLAATQGTTP
jgi:hypothetical protein